MEYWPVYLIIALFTIWMCKYPLPSDNHEPEAFRTPERFKLLVKWGLFLVALLLSAFIAPVFFFIAIGFFAMTGLQMQSARSELLKNKNV